MQTSLSNLFGKNLVTNSLLDIWQRNLSFTADSTKYMADRFQFQISGSGRYVVTRSTDVPLNSRSAYSWRQECDVANGSLNPGDYSLIAHKIEGLFFRKVKGRDLVFSMDVKSSVPGVYTVGFRNGVFDKAYVAEYTINQANTWEKKVIKFKHDATGTWLYDNSIGMEILLITSSGSTYHGTAGVWGNGNNISTSNQTNLLATLGNTFQFANPKFHDGFDVLDDDILERSFDHELLLCQRYFEKSYPLDVPPGTIDIFNGNAQVITSSNQNFSDYIAFKANKRDIPIGTMYNTNSGAVNSYLSVSIGSKNGSIASPGINGMSAYSTESSGTAGNHALFHWTADSEL